MKRSLLIFAVFFWGVSVSAQIYDGITQPTKFRLLLPVVKSLHGSSTGISPMFGYKYEAAEWLSVTPMLQYNLNTDNLSPQVWLNLNYRKTYYLLSRSIYDSKTERFRETLSATIKLPLNFMVDATWEDMCDGTGFVLNDRLQVVGGFAEKRFILNAGYAMRRLPGFIANIRFKITEYNWLQLRYDSGAETIGISVALQVNRL